MKRALIGDLGVVTTLLSYISWEAVQSIIGLTITVAVGIPTALLKWRELREFMRKKKLPHTSGGSQ